MNDTTTSRKPAIWNHEPLPHVRRVIAIASGKGGVGKSTLTVSLAATLQKKGTAVGILDADIYGPSIPRMLGLETRLKPEIVAGKMMPPISHGIKAMSMALITGDDAAILRAPMVTKSLVQLLRMSEWGTATAPLDVLLVDTPPGTGDVHLSMAQQAPLDGVMIVTTPQQVAVMDADKALQMFLKLGVPILGVIENMSYFRDAAGTEHYLFGEGGGEALAAKYNVPFLGKVPLDPALGAALDNGDTTIAAEQQALQRLADDLLKSALR